MKELRRDIIGTTTGDEIFEYTWRDSALYALGVGATMEQNYYLDEKAMKAVPSFGVIPYWGTFGITPYRSIPRNVFISLGLDLTGSLHMSHKLEIYKPLNPLGGRLTIRDVVTEIYDRNGRGTIVRTELSGYDESGEKLFTNFGDNYVPAYSAPGSPLFPKSTVVIPDRAPDYIEEAELSTNQNILYRLSGDTNPLHFYQSEAEKFGFSRPIMQGLCSFGYGCQMAAKAVLGNSPEKTRSIFAQFRNPLYPGSRIVLHLWVIDENTAYFRLIDSETGKPILEKGEFLWNSTD